MKKRVIATCMIIALLITNSIGNLFITRAENDSKEQTEYCYGYAMEDRKEMLPEWDHWIDNTMDYAIVTEEGEEWLEERVGIISLTTDDSDDVISIEGDENGWNIHANHEGTATVTMVHEKTPGCSEEDYVEKTFEVSVQQVIYDVRMRSTIQYEDNGIELAHPGDEYDVWVQVRKHFWNQEEENHGYEEVTDFTTEWSVNSDAPIEVVKSDGNRLSVAVKTDVSGFDETEVDIIHSAVLDIKDGNEEGTPYEFDGKFIDVRSEFYYILPIATEVDMLPEVGESIEIRPELYCSIYGQEPELIEGEITYEWEYDENALQIDDITEENGPVNFKVTKMDNSYTEACIHAIVGEGEEQIITRGWYFFDELPYDAWFEDLKAEDHSWLYADMEGGAGEEHTIKLNTTQLADYENWQVRWDIGVRNEEDITILDVNEEQPIYSVENKEDGSYLTLYGNYLKEALKDALGEGAEELFFVARAVIVAGNEEVSTEVWQDERDIWVHDEYIEYRHKDEMAMLPHWDEGLDKNLDGFVESKMYPEGMDFSVEIIDVEVSDWEGKDDGESASISITPWEDEMGWNLHAEHFGWADITYTYQLFDSEETATHTFRIWGSDRVYSLDVSTDTGTDQVLPGEMLTFYPHMSIECYNEEQGHYSGSTDGITYTWELCSPEVEEFITYKENDDGSLSFEVNEDIMDDYDVWLDVIAYEEGADGPEEVARQSAAACIRNSFYQIILEEGQQEALNGLDIGATAECTPTLKYFERDREAEIINTGIKYVFDGCDTEAIKITDINGDEINLDETEVNEFQITKTQFYYTEFDLVACLEDEEGNFNEVTRIHLTFDDLNYDVWFNDLRGDGHTWVFTNGDDQADGEAYNLVLNAEALEGKSYQVEWQFRRRMDSEEEFECFDVSKADFYSLADDNLSVTIKGNKLRAFLAEQGVPEDENYINICAIVKLGNDEIDVSSADADIWIRDECVEYEHYEERSCLPGWGFDIEKNISVYVETPEYPDGEFRQLSIKELIVENVDDDGDDILAVSDWDNQEGWYVEPQRFGQAQITYVYEDIDGNDQEYSFMVYVVGEYFTTDITSASGSDRVHLGESVTLIPHTLRERYDEDEGHYEGNVEGCTYKWELFEPETAEFLEGEKFTVNDDNTISFTVKDNEEYEGSSIGFSVVTYLNDEEVSYAEYWVFIENGYYEIAIPEEEIEALRNLDIKGSITLHPELKWIEKGQDPQVISENMEFYCDYNSDVIDLEMSGNEIQVTRKENWESTIWIFAMIRDSEEEEFYDVAGMNLEISNRSYEIAFESERDWIFYNEDRTGEAYSGIRLDTGNTSDIEGVVYGFGLVVYEEDGDYHIIEEDGGKCFVVNEDNTLTLYAGEIQKELDKLEGYFDYVSVEATARVDGDLIAWADYIMNLRCGINYKMEVSADTDLSKLGAGESINLEGMLYEYTGDAETKKEVTDCVYEWQLETDSDVFKLTEDEVAPNKAKLEVFSDADLSERQYARVILFAKDKDGNELYAADYTVSTCDHRWDFIKQEDPTYTEEGKKHYHCDDCGARKEVSIPPLENPVKDNPFVDVKETDYFYDAVLWAKDAGVTAGVDATHFGPENPCTRAQAVSFLWRAAGSPEPTTTDNPFVDVKTGDYFYKAVLWAKEAGVTAGTTATTFSPNATCTRGQIVSFLCRRYGSPEPTSTNNPFVDVKETDYFYKAVLWANETGITAGTTATTFSPNAPCTRAQIVTFLYRDMVE